MCDTVVKIPQALRDLESATAPVSVRLVGRKMSDRAPGERCVRAFAERAR
jgi:hypothetical protein